MNKKYSIVITTFSKRFDLVTNLITQIREVTTNPIILTINGEMNGEFNEEYRKNILNFCVKFDSIYPIFFTEIRSLSKLWNLGTINSNLDDVLILNDDIIILDNNFFTKCDDILNEDVNIVLFNNSFSHFFVNKNFLDKIGYFDEHLLGFGWEDTDMWMRFKELTGETIKNVDTISIHNESSDLIYDDIKTTWGKYSLYNYEYIKTKYSNGNADRYMCGKKLKEDINPYPTESYFLDNKHLIFNNENN
jgi:hypothetical protein